MNARENALRITRFDHPEQVVGGPPSYTIGYRGVNHEGFDGGGHHLPVGSRWTDIWGTTWEKEHADVMGFPVGPPLANLPGSLHSYTWPSPDDERICGPIAEGIAKWDRVNQFLAGSHRDTLWEKCYMLVGMEDALCAFHMEPEAMREVLHRIMDFQLGMARHYLAAGVEMVNMSDDLGMQCRPLMAPDTIRSFLVPEYRRLFDLYREHGVWVNFHSCGHIEPVLDIFLDLGVNILNPVQATANDLDAVRRRTQGCMALQGGISTGLVMEGPPERIRMEVKARLWQLGRDGGYFCAPDQGMPFPEAHIRAFREAVAEFGRYPLTEPGQETR